jgi:hypothetical protein
MTTEFERFWGMMKAIHAQEERVEAKEKAAFVV